MGVTEGTFSIPIIDDVLDEIDSETFLLEIVRDGTSREVTVSITDNDDLRLLILETRRSMKTMRWQRFATH